MSTSFVQETCSDKNLPRLSLYLFYRAFLPFFSVLLTERLKLPGTKYAT